MMSREILEKYPENDRSNLIAMMQDLQEKYGYLEQEALEDVAEYVGLPLSTVYGVATFYNQFRLLPLGKYIVHVCRGTACHVKNSANLLMALENELGIKAGETTKDGLFTIEVVACIGACSIAPVININDEYYGRLEVKDIGKIIKKLRLEAKKELEAKEKNESIMSNEVG